MNQLLDTICCKDCKSCIIKKINHDSIIYSCSKDNYINPDKLELYVNKKCFVKRGIKSK